MTVHEVMLLKTKRGGIHGPLKTTPLLTITADSWYMYIELIVTVVDTRKFQ